MVVRSVTSAGQGASAGHESGAAQDRTAADEQGKGACAGYVLPLLHAHVPDPVVELGFFAALAATAALGIVDAPLAVLVGAGVLVARHGSQH